MRNLTRLTPPTRPTRTARTALQSLVALLLAGSAWAQTPAAAQAAPNVTKAAAKPAPKAAAKPIAKPAVAAAALEAASAEQLSAAGMTHLGAYDCDLGETVSVQPTPRHEGYVDVMHKKSTWTMKPVLSSTGALRLEDVKGRMLMLQVANKSMVMDVKVGQRVLDGCLHEKQKNFVNPNPGQSLGIAPPAAAPAASAPR